ncbi:MAG: SDR family oxidoreductase [Oligoflexales bacterium]|nr:SDR family oxidoreductase [Oligoflexales bacterium]
MNTEKQHILVTGAGGWLGRHVVRDLLAQGHHVAAACLDQKAEEGLRSWIKIPAPLLKTGNCQLSQEDSVQKMLDTFQKERPISGLIHAAGSFHYAQVEDTALDHFDSLLDSNLRSSWILAKSLVPQMKKNQNGHMIFISSRSTQGFGEKGMSLYLASKAALNLFAQSLAQELKEDGVSINVVMPSVIDGPANRDAMPGADFTRWVNVELLSSFLVSLLGPLGSQLHGSLIPFASRV